MRHWASASRPAAKVEEDVRRVAAQERAVGQAQAVARRLGDAFLDRGQRLLAAQVKVEQRRLVRVAAHDLVEFARVTGRFECLIEQLQTAIDPAQETGVHGRGIRGVRELAKASVAGRARGATSLFGARRALVELARQHQLLGERRERRRSRRCRLRRDRERLLEGFARTVRVATRRR